MPGDHTVTRLIGFTFLPLTEARTAMSLSLSELKEKTPTELAEFARSLKLDNVTRLRKQDQIFAILKSQAKRGEKIKGAGVVEILQDGFGFLRSASSSYLAGPDDVYVSPSQIRRFGLRTGDSPCAGSRDGNREGQASRRA